MPEVTEKLIRVPTGIQCEVTATINISAEQGIQALYCGEEKKIRTYLFSRDHDWTLEKAKKWVSEHKKKSVEVGDMADEENEEETAALESRGYKVLEDGAVEVAEGAAPLEELKAEDREKLEQAQKKRAGSSGIEPKDKGNLTRPSQYSDCPDNNANWGDWTNYRYPLVPEARAGAAVTRFNDATNQAKGGYDDGEWGKIGRRIATKNGEDYSYDADSKQVIGPTRREEEEGKATKDESLDARSQQVREAFIDRFRRPEPEEAPYRYVREVFEDYVIVEGPEGLLKYPYSEDDEGKIAFGEAVQVEVQYAEKAAQLFAVKAHPSGEWGRICGWGAPYGGPFDGKDLQGEYFSAETDFALNWYPEGRPLLYHHGKEAPGIVPVGREITAEKLDLGVWVEAQLDKANQYAKYIWDLVQKKKLFWSSGALPHLVQKAMDGHLKQWVVCEWTMTPTPANPLATLGAAEAKAHFEAVGLKFHEIEQASEPVLEGRGDSSGGELDMGEEEKREELKAIELSQEQKDEMYADFQRRMEEEAQAKAQAETEEQERRDALKAELRLELLKEQAEEAAKKGLPFPFAVEEDGEKPAIPEAMKRYMVKSRWDNWGVLDLATEFYVRQRASLLGNVRRPTQAMFRALAVKANEMWHETDEIPYMDRRGRVKMFELPAFDPRVVERWEGEDEDDVMDVPDFGTVKAVDNVTPEGLKAMIRIGAAKADDLVYSTQSGYGSDWVPTLMAAALWRTIRLEAQVLGLFDQFDMPSQPYEHPSQGAGPTFYTVPETKDEDQLVIGTTLPTPDSKIATAKVTFSAGKAGAITFWSEEQREDSLVPVEPTFRDQFGVATAHNVDYLILNGDETTGDTSNVSYYGASPAAKSRMLAIDGLRNEPLRTTVADARAGGVLVLNDMNATRKLMGTAGVYGANPSQLVALCDVSTGLTFEDLDEVVTVDKFGPQATILRGEVGRIKGIPIVKSEDYGLTYTNGKIHSTGINNTKGSFIIVNRLGVRIGWRRRPRILVGQIPFADAWYIISLCRFDVGFFGVGMVGMTYNLTV